MKTISTLLAVLACAVQTGAGTIQVRGSAERMVEPDTVVCRFDVSATHKTADQAAAAFAQRQNAVIAALTEAGFTSAEVAMNAVSMAPEFEYGSLSGKSFKGFRHAATHRVTFAFDRARLAKLYRALSGGEAAENFTIEFSCRDSAAVLKALRQEAVADAMRKAKEYAQGFGVAVQGLERAEEAQAGFAPVEGVRYLSDARAKVAGAAAPDFERLTPQQIRFESAVLATFEVGK